MGEAQKSVARFRVEGPRAARANIGSACLHCTGEEPLKEPEHIERQEVPGFLGMKLVVESQGM